MTRLDIFQQFVVTKAGILSQTVIFSEPNQVDQVNIHSRLMGCVKSSQRADILITLKPQKPLYSLLFHSLLKGFKGPAEPSFLTLR